MTHRIGSRRRKTRYMLTRSVRDKGKVPLSKFFATFVEGDKVNLKTNSNIAFGQFFRRFYGMTGTITGKMKGTCYEVKINDMNKAKILFVHPIHMTKG